MDLLHIKTEVTYRFRSDLNHEGFPKNCELPMLHSHYGWYIQPRTATVTFRPTGLPVVQHAVRIIGATVSLEGWQLTTLGKVWRDARSAVISYHTGDFGSWPGEVRVIYHDACRELTGRPFDESWKGLNPA